MKETENIVTVELGSSSWFAILVMCMYGMAKLRDGLGEYSDPTDEDYIVLKNFIQRTLPVVREAASEYYYCKEKDFEIIRETLKELLHFIGLAIPENYEDVLKQYVKITGKIPIKRV
jgi:hypothetical protein